MIILNLFQFCTGNDLLFDEVRKKCHLQGLDVVWRQFKTLTSDGIARIRQNFDVYYDFNCWSPTLRNEFHANEQRKKNDFTRGTTLEWCSV